MFDWVLSTPLMLRVLPKNFAVFTKKQLCWSLFLIKLQGCKNMMMVDSCHFEKNSYFS